MQPSLQPADYTEVQALLPDSVQQIAGLIGFPATEALIRHFGGVPFRIGKGLRGAGERRIAPLQEILTPSQVALLMRHFGGEEHIPRCDKAGRTWRNRCFLAELDQLLAGGVHQHGPDAIVPALWHHRDPRPRTGVPVSGGVTA
ncbi:MAG: hypothetical protein ACR5LG_13295 [Sodalis sp. (in: enterobacteria)]|uniref:hypothetical protein n=1 Tax=Sodalis sp. (in: enterobacteria) TaxID=1898979 RepID=UPI003F3ED48B